MKSLHLNDPENCFIDSIFTDSFNKIEEFSKKNNSDLYKLLVNYSIRCESFILCYKIIKVLLSDKKEN